MSITAFALRLLLRIDPKPIVIERDGSPVYMTRYRLVNLPWLHIHVHHFNRGDLDPCLHDHPYRFVTFILAGGYMEVMPLGERWRPPGTMLYRPAKFAHRIVALKPAWSLVFAGRKWRTWGFFSKRGWRAWFPGMAPLCE